MGHLTLTKWEKELKASVHDAYSTMLPTFDHYSNVFPFVLSIIVLISMFSFPSLFEFQVQGKLLHSLC